LRGEYTHLAKDFSKAIRFEDFTFSSEIPLVNFLAPNLPVAVILCARAIERRYFPPTGDFLTNRCNLINCNN
jgi:hypothetical protein